MNKIGGGVNKAVRKLIEMQEEKQLPADPPKGGGAPQVRKQIGLTPAQVSEQAADRAAATKIGLGVKAPTKPNPVVSAAEVKPKYRGIGL